MIPGLVHDNEDFSTPSSSPATSRRSSIQSEDDRIEFESEFEAKLKPADQRHDPQLGKS